MSQTSRGKVTRNLGPAKIIDSVEQLEKNVRTPKSFISLWKCTTVDQQMVIGGTMNGESKWIWVHQVISGKMKHKADLAVLL